MLTGHNITCISYVESYLLLDVLGKIKRSHVGLPSFLFFKAQLAVVVRGYVHMCDHTDFHNGCTTRL